MKNFFTLCLILLAANVAFAQNPSKAKQFLKDKKYSEAAQAIEAAVSDPKLSTKAETWFTRAEVYITMLENEEEDVRSQEPKAVDYVSESFAKVKSIENGKGKYTNLIDVSIPGVTVALNDRLFNALYNGAIQNQSDPDKALEYFEKLYKIYPDNIFAARYVTRFAVFAEEDEKAVNFANQFLANPKFQDSLNVINEVMQYGVMAAERSGKKDEAKKMIEAAMTKFPKEPFYLNRLINILINDKKYEEALNYLKTGLELTKDTKIRAMYLSNMGLLALDLKKNDEAVKYFEESVKLDPENFMAQFYLGANYFNQAVEIENTMTSNEVGKDNEKTRKVKELFTKALPFLEKAHQLDPNKTSVYHPLLTVYKSILGAGDAKTKALQAKIAALADDED
jgi:tetratricopeptide (TPR) repeat protein